MTQNRFPMTIGGEEVLNEHHLLAYTENGEMMDSPQSVRFLVIHCSATRADRQATNARPQEAWFPHRGLPLLCPQGRKQHAVQKAAGGRCPCPTLQPMLHRHLLRGRTR